MSKGIQVVLNEIANRAAYFLPFSPVGIFLVKSGLHRSTRADLDSISPARDSCYSRYFIIKIFIEKLNG